MLLVVAIMTGCHQEGFEEALFDDSEYYDDTYSEETLDDSEYYDDTYSEETLDDEKYVCCISSDGRGLKEGDNVSAGGIYILHGFIEEIKGTQARVRWFSMTDTWGDPVSESDENFYLTMAGYQLNHSYWVEGSKIEYEKN
jgi:hypothetical protein